MQIKAIEFIEQERIEKEFKKVVKKEKSFEKTFNIFKKSLLIENNIYSKVRISNSFKIIDKTHCDKKQFWKAYIRDSKYDRMIRIIFFIQKNVLYIIEIFHKDFKDNCDYILLKKYCDF